MWKKVGSVSGQDDNRSNRSFRSRDQMNPEPFHKSLEKRSQMAPDHNRSFCYDYFQKKKKNGSRSEKSLKLLNESVREDMFTSMRNILNKDDKNGESKGDSKNQEESAFRQMQERGKPTNVKQRINKSLNSIKTLKREHKNLRQDLKGQVTSIKNILYQLEDMLHTHTLTNEAPASDSQPKKQDKDKQVDLGMLSSILEDAMAVERYFAQMDKKKQAILERISND